MSLLSWNLLDLSSWYFSKTSLMFPSEPLAPSHFRLIIRISIRTYSNTLWGGGPGHRRRLRSSLRPPTPTRPLLTISKAEPKQRCSSTDLNINIKTKSKTTRVMWVNLSGGCLLDWRSLYQVGRFNLQHQLWPVWTYWLRCWSTWRWWWWT